MIMKCFIRLFLAFGVCSPLYASGTELKPKPNVLLISLDDLNDWIEPLGGHPQVQTPNMTAFAEEAVTFSRAYCASPSCNPSRTAIMTEGATRARGVL